jgi:hypothetical protein
MKKTESRKSRDTNPATVVTEEFKNSCVNTVQIIRREQKIPKCSNSFGLLFIPGAKIDTGQISLVNSAKYQASN